MATTATVTSTSIALDELSSRRGDISVDYRSANRSRKDDVAEASRVADAGVPDGGYEAWVALAGSGVICWWFVGTTYCWGVIQGALVKDGLSSASTLSWIGSLAVACNAFLAILSARFLRGLGSRLTAILGISFVAGGEILSSFTTHNVGGLFVTAGVVLGIGVSLCFTVVGSVPAQYFNRKRGLATGIVFASGGLGGAVISFLMEALLRETGSWS